MNTNLGRIKPLYIYASFAIINASYDSSCLMQTQHSKFSEIEYLNNHQKQFAWQLFRQLHWQEIFNLCIGIFMLRNYRFLKYMNMGACTVA